MGYEARRKDKGLKRSTKLDPRTMSDDDVFGVILKAANDANRQYNREHKGRRISAQTRLAAMTIGTVAATKLWLRAQRSQGDDFRPDVWEMLEQRSDDLAAEHVKEITGSEEVAGLQLKSERPYLHVVRNRKGIRFCPTAISDDEPSPFPEGLMAPELPNLADEITWKIVAELSSLQSALHDATKEQRTSWLIAQTIGLVACTKLHLSLWGNGKLSAGFEEIADRVAARELELMKKA